MTHPFPKLAAVLATAALAMTLAPRSEAAPMPTLPKGKASPPQPPAAAAADSLDLGEIKKLLLDGTPGDWKFVTSKKGELKSGMKLRLGSDYSGACMTYKSQDIGINLGHVADCAKTKGGDNVAFELTLGGGDGKVVKFGDTVAFSMARDGDRAYVCYGVRDNGINLNWGKNDDECKKRDGSKGNGARQWKLMPVAGSSKKVGDPIDLADRFALHSVVADQGVVKCARIYAALPPPWYAGDLKWRKDCKHHELVWTHRELLEKLGEDPKALARKFVPSEFAGALEKLL